MFVRTVRLIAVGVSRALVVIKARARELMLAGLSMGAESLVKKGPVFGVRCRGESNLIMEVGAFGVLAPAIRHMIDVTWSGAESQLNSVDSFESSYHCSKCQIRPYEDVFRVRRISQLSSAYPSLPKWYAETG